MKSIKVYLVAAVLSAMTLTIFISALQGYRTSMVKADALFDKKLDAIASLLMSIYGHPSSLSAASTGAHVPPLSGVSDTPDILYQVWREAPEASLIDGLQSTPLASFEEGFSYHNYLGYRWRVLTRYQPERSLWVMVGERTDLRFMLAENVVVESILPILIGLPIAAFFIWWLIGSGLAILNRLTSDLTHKQVDDLTQLHYDNTPKELTSVIDSINRLFYRLDQSFQRERNFAADAAHELRTPISALKVHVYNLKQQLPENSQILRAIDSDLMRLEHLVEQILLLYRSTPENYNAKPVPVDLKALVTEELAAMYSGFEKRHQSIELHAGDAVTVSGEPNFLKILISNLLSNANKYTPESGSVVVDLEEAGDRVWLRVSNSGPGIPAQEYDRVFDRFYRVGGDRHASEEPGCGLGLSIVKHIADLHKANIVLGRTREDLFSIAVGFSNNLSSQAGVENG